MDPATGVEYRGREYPWGVVNIEDQVILMMMMMMMVMLMVCYDGDDDLFRSNFIKSGMFKGITVTSYIFEKEFCISSNSDIFQDHCDFMPLRNLVLAHHMQDLKDVSLSSSSSS